jgi:cytochrome c oxidase subunit 2
MPFLAQASSASARIDSVFLWVFAVCLAFLLLISFFLVYFSVRYRRSRNQEPEDIEGNAWLEVVWTLVPLALFLVMFYYGWTDFQYLRNPPKDAPLVQVIARQWAWSFKYPNGKQSDQLYAALGRPMKLETHTLDVIHGFFVPAFRVKIDVVPGRRNTVWFTPTLLGDFDIQCTVICGVNHSAMLSKVRVVSEADFKRWYFSDDAAPPAPAAAPASSRESAVVGLLRGKACLACHSIDGSPMVGPTFKGLFGSRQSLLIDGERRSAAVDAALLRRAIRKPGSVQVLGYPPIMPPASLSDDELEAVVAYLRSL